MKGKTKKHPEVEQFITRSVILLLIAAAALTLFAYCWPTVDESEVQYVTGTVRSAYKGKVPNFKRHGSGIDYHLIFILDDGLRYDVGKEYLPMDDLSAYQGKLCRIGVTAPKPHYDEMTERPTCSLEIDGKMYFGPDDVNSINRSRRRLLSLVVVVMLALIAIVWVGFPAWTLISRAHERHRLAKKKAARDARMDEIRQSWAENTERQRSGKK